MDLLMDNPGLPQGVALWAITALTFIHCRRRARKEQP